MKRDMALIRLILLYVEEKQDNEFPDSLPVFEGYTKDQFEYNVSLLNEAGYIEARQIASVNYFGWAPMRMTWIGHEFLDSIRSDSVWSRLKESFGTELSKLPVATISAVALEVSKEWALKKLRLK